jgi:hypothetical protein
VLDHCLGDEPDAPERLGALMNAAIRRSASTALARRGSCAIPVRPGRDRAKEASVVSDHARANASTPRAASAS